MLRVRRLSSAEAPMSKHSVKDAQAVVALDLGGTKLASALFVADGPPLEQRSIELDGSEGPAVGQLIAAECRRVLDAATRRGHAVCALGASVPGIANRGRVWAPNIPGWDDYPLADELRAAVDVADMQVAVDNDRAASIL